MGRRCLACFLARYAAARSQFRIDADLLEHVVGDIAERSGADGDARPVPDSYSLAQEPGREVGIHRAAILECQTDLNDRAQNTDCNRFVPALCHGVWHFFSQKVVQDVVKFVVGTQNHRAAASQRRFFRKAGTRPSRNSAYPIVRRAAVREGTGADLSPSASPCWSAPIVA